MTFKCVCPICKKQIPLPPDARATTLGSNGWLPVYELICSCGTTVAARTSNGEVAALKPATPPSIEELADWDRKYEERAR
jgi:hypothetical protein